MTIPLNHSALLETDTVKVDTGKCKLQSLIFRDAGLINHPIQDESGNPSATQIKYLPYWAYLYSSFQARSLWNSQDGSDSKPGNSNILKPYSLDVDRICRVEIVWKIYSAGVNNACVLSSLTNSLSSHFVHLHWPSWTTSLFLLFAMSPLQHARFERSSFCNCLPRNIKHKTLK